ncbi:MAG TPA: hypothetical protein VLI06_18065 [Solimonas sp.]|nr:hypothetical protein [Solimonas sp.]
MGQHIQDLFTVAMGGGTIRRYGEMVVLTLPGVELVTTSDDIQQAQRWARSRNSSGQEQLDRDAMLARLETLIARNESGGPTRGTDDIIARLAKRMRTNEMNLDEWNLPQTVLEVLARTEPQQDST